MALDFSFAGREGRRAQAPWGDGGRKEEEAGQKEMATERNGLRKMMWKMGRVKGNGPHETSIRLFPSNLVNVFLVVSLAQG